MNNVSAKFIFFGSSEFSIIVLKELIKQNWRPLAVVTAPEKPVGKKQVLTATPVKILALGEKIPVLEPEKLDNFFAEDLKKKPVDFFIVASYGKIIPHNILALPYKGCLNIHPSLLPKYRGASPIQTTLLNNDKETGVTIMLMDEKMDHGPIIKQEKMTIDSQIKFQDLHDLLALKGVRLLIKILPDFLNDKVEAQRQDHQKATFSKIIKKNDGEVDWQKTSLQIYNQWRAFHKWPGIFSNLKLNNQKVRIKFLDIDLSNLKKEKNDINLVSVEFFVLDKKLYLSGSDGQLIQIIKLQVEGKKEMLAENFINGYLKSKSNL